MSQDSDREIARPEDSVVIGEWLRATQDPGHPAWQTPGRPARGAYTGDVPTGLARVVLDLYVTRRIHHGRRPHRHAYWASEVEEATRIAAAWSSAVAAGMPAQEVMRWIAVLNAASAEQAAALFAEGVDPAELQSNRADAGRPDLATRLVVGNLTVEQVIAEVARRRLAG